MQFLLQMNLSFKTKKTKLVFTTFTLAGLAMVWPIFTILVLRKDI